MALKLWNTILFCIFLPIVIYMCNLEVFNLFMVIAVWFVCCKSLYRLYIYNFASDEVLYRYEEKYRPLSYADVIYRRIINISVTVLFFAFFAMFGLYQSGIIKYAALVAAALWLFDLVKTIHSYFTKSISEEYSFFDAVLEALMWIQNVLSIVLVVVLIIQ